MDPSYEPYVPIIASAIFVVALVAVILILNRFLGPRRPTKIKSIPWESGVDPVAQPRRRHPVKFYMTGILFLVFDLEIVFIYPWASRYKEWLGGDFGGIALGSMLVFITILMVGFVYEYKRGAMEWE